MNRSFKDLQIIAIFMVIWIILNENAGMFTLLTGITISILTLKYTNILLKMDYGSEFYVPLVGFIIYGLSMIKQVYVSGFDMMKRILKGDITPTFIEYETELEDEFCQILLANSVTLPPGSVTVARDENKLLILSANSNELEVRQEVEMFEKKLKNLEKDPVRKKLLRKYAKEVKEELKQIER